MISKTLTGFLIFLVLLFAGTTLYFASKTAAPVPTPAPTIEIEEPALITEQDESPKSQSAWSTYTTSEPIAFTIQYPKDWPVFGVDPSKCGGEFICGASFGTFPTDPADREGRSNVFVILIHPPALVEASGGDRWDHALCKNIRPVVLKSGLEASVGDCSQMDDIPVTMYSISKQGWIFEMIGGEGEEISKVFDHMVNSFSFTEQ